MAQWGKRKDDKPYVKRHSGINSNDIKVGASINADANIKGTDVKMILNTDDIQHHVPSLSVQVDSQKLLKETENYLKNHKKTATLTELAKGLNIDGNNINVLWAALANSNQFEIQTKNFTSDTTTVKLK